MDRAYLRRCGAHGTALWLASAAVLLVLTACASRPEPGGPPGERFGGREGPGGPDGGPRRPNLFVSPAGEPFRAPPGAPYPVAAWFRGADANGDGKLTRDEFVADAARFFAALDSNRDGIIDGLELKAYETDVVPEITEERGGGPTGGQGQSVGGGQGGGRDGGQGGGRRRRGGGFGQGASGGGPGPATPQASGAASFGLLGEREPVASADLDLNSRITLANFKTKAERRFALLDIEGKGYLLLTDLPKTAVQRQAESRAKRGDRTPPAPGAG